MRPLRSLLVTCLLACNTTSSGGTDEGPADHGALPLSIEPAVLDIEAPEPIPALVRRLVARSPRDGDVTERAEWTLSSTRLATLRGGELTLQEGLREGGQAVIVARYRGATAMARLRLKLLARPYFDETAPPDAEGTLGRAGPGGPAPALVYPLDGALLPRNQGGMNLQFRADAGQLLFRITADGPTFRQDFYLGAGRCQVAAEARCQWPVPDALWHRVAASAAGEALALTVAGAGGERLGRSAPLTLHFSPEDVRGGLYYFSTSQWGLLRLPFGGTRALPFLIGDRLSQTGGCIGCHASTRDGRRVAAVFGGGDGYGGIIDGTDANTFLRPPRALRDGGRGFSSQRQGQVWNFASYSPDGERLITTWAGRMELRDGKTGDLIAQVKEDLLGGLATMPDWSPDGAHIAFVRIPPFGRIGKDLAPVRDFGEMVAGDWFLKSAGDIALLPYNNGAFGPAITVVPAVEQGEFHFYPSFSPDSRFLVFNSARHGQCDTDTGDQQGVGIGPDKCTTYDQTAARLRLVEARPGAQPLELRHATALPNRTTAWPRFSPFLQDGGRLSFITFSAKLDYGFLLVQPTDRAARRPQLWMAAVDLKRAGLGQEDPSFAPFWLPFQDLAERNHQAIWTHDLICRTAADCGPGWGCEAGLCVPRLE